MLEHGVNNIKKVVHRVGKNNKLIELAIIFVILPENRALSQKRQWGDDSIGSAAKQTANN